MSDKQESNTKMDGLTRWMLIAAILFTLFSFVAPWLFTQFSIIDFTGKGTIGDTLGGIMNPFIAIAGILLTYLAFYMQFNANRIQREQFGIQLEQEKNRFSQELNEQRQQQIKTSFENQFYEMLRLHKENVNEIYITIKRGYYSEQKWVKTSSSIRGRETFEYLLEEMNLTYNICQNFITNHNDILNLAYKIFFSGFKGFSTYEIPLEGWSKLLVELNDLRFIIDNSNNFSVVQKMDEYNPGKSKTELSTNALLGYSSSLAHYYRHLYQLVKFVCNQNDDFLSYEEKRKYLRVLRAQLSNPEQALLFYNWKSGFGKKWEDDTNKFFSDFRMIHNLYQDLIVKDISLIEVFDLKEPPNYKMEAGRKNDFLFEFQD